jgi:hypothetical protein
MEPNDQIARFGIAVTAHAGEVLFLDGPLGEHDNIITRMSPPVARNFAYWLARAYCDASDQKAA